MCCICEVKSLFNIKRKNTIEVIHSPSFPYDLTQSFYQMYIRVFVSVFEGICRCMGLFTRMTGFGWLPIDGSKGTHMNVLFRCYIVSYFGTHIICTSKASMRSTGKKMPAIPKLWFSAFMVLRL